MTADDSSHDEIDHVFVYGTLMPGHLRWPALQPYVVEQWQDTVPGRLYDTGRGYPGASFGTGGRIPGWGLRLRADQVAEAVELLDRIEGEHLFRRRLVATGVGRPAWAYELLEDPASMTPIEGWSAGRDEG